MNRKQSFNSRSTASGFDHKSYQIYKQNEKDSFRLDPKIVQLKKKYQLDKPLQFNSNKQPLKQVDNNQQEEVLKKLESIKSELRLIPGWENYARSILFEQPNFSKPHTPSFQCGYQNFAPFSRKNQQVPHFKKQITEESKVLNCSNISFKISQANSVQRHQEKSKHLKQSFNQYTPSRKVNEFMLQKNKTGNKQQIYSTDQDSKKVDQKINEISRKIKQAEAQKKNLGVDFVPFEKKSVLLKNQTTRMPLQQFQFQRSKTPQSLFRPKDQPIKQRNSRPPKPSKTHTKVRSSQETLSPKLFRNQPNPRFPFTQQHYQQKGCIQLLERDLKTKSQQNKKIYQWQKQMLNQNSLKNYSNYYDNTSESHNLYIQTIHVPKNILNDKNKSYFENKPEERINDRRKKTNEGHQKRIKKQNTIKLVQCFTQQVKLDQKFRNAKLWLKNCKNEKKYERLKSLLNMQGLNLSIEKIIEQFQVLQKQDNPFFSVTSIQCDLEQVAKCYLQSQKFWKKYLFKKFNRDALQQQDFTSLTIDLQKKGYISLQDLVRFLNMETGTFFRNRDLFTIYRRLCGNSQKLNFNSFINTFCS